MKLMKKLGVALLILVVLLSIPTTRGFAQGFTRSAMVLGASGFEALRATVHDLTGPSGSCGTSASSPP